VTTPILCWDDDLDAAPRVRHLFSAAEAERLFGIRANTIRVWHHRGQIHPAGIDERDRPLYDRDDLFRLRGASGTDVVP
jgi:hypothetical protein